MSKNVYVLGKCDYTGTGSANCKATFEWELKDGRFSMQASVWNPAGTDTYMGGQCIEEVLSFFPENYKAQRMAAVWRDWHLNDLKAGSPAQEAYLKANPVTDRLHYYEAACDALKAARLNPDPNYLHNGKPYHYGSVWLTQELPADIIEEINSWSQR